MNDPRSSRKRIFVVDDEPKIVRLIVANLESLGYEGHGCSQAGEAVHGAARLNPDLIILDLMMPGMDGFQVLQELREFCDAPVIILTARDQQADKLRGFELGADDYLTKPFALEELFARVKALLRRTVREHDAAPAAEFTHGALRLGFADHRAWAGDQELRLTATEFRLLATLARRAGRVLTHEYLLESAWGAPHSGDIPGLRVALTRLRHKLRDAGMDAECIRTYVGIGYMMDLSRLHPS